MVSSQRVSGDQFAADTIAISDRYVAIPSHQTVSSSRYFTAGYLHIFDRNTWQEVAVLDVDSLGAMFVSDVLMVNNGGSRAVTVYNLEDWTVRQELAGWIVDNKGSNTFTETGLVATTNAIYQQDNNGQFSSVLEIPQFFLAGSSYQFNGSHYVVYDEEVVSYNPYNSYREIRTWYLANNGNWIEAPSLRDDERERKFQQNARYELVDNQLAIFSTGDTSNGFEFFRFTESSGWVLEQSFDAGPPFSLTAPIYSQMSLDVQATDSTILWEGSTSVYTTHMTTHVPDSIQTLVYQKNDQGIWSQTIFNRETPAAYFNNGSYSPANNVRPSSSLTNLGLFFMTEQSDELLIPEFAIGNDQPFTDDCDYQNAELFDGWGWNPVTRVSCPPLTIEEQSFESGCDYSSADLYGGWGWNSTVRASCEPRIEPDTSANTAMCDYSQADSNNGWGWNSVQMVSCEPIN